VSEEPAWLEADDLLLFHAQLVGTFGGLGGVRDEGVLQSAMVRPRQAHVYRPLTLPQLAGLYAEALVQSHPFVDGNRRIAFVAVRVFLGLNRVAFDPPEVEAVVLMEALAAGDLSAEELASWIAKHSAPAAG